MAQNDTCATAIPITLGTNGPFTNVAATTSLPAFTCAPGGNDVWYVFAGTNNGIVTASLCGADFDSCIEVYNGPAGCSGLASLACNDDFCSLQSQVSFATTTGGTYYLRVGGYNSTVGNFPLELTFAFDYFLEGVAESTPNSGTLSQVGSLFAAGDTMRWNHRDPRGAFPGYFTATVLNLGAGPQSIGITAGLPGFDMLWVGSTPTGYAFILPPHVIGAPDYQLSFPANFFAAGQTIRIQGLVLDPSNAPGALPVIPTRNSIIWTKDAGTCITAEGFENTTSGVGNYPTGWSDGGGTAMWSANNGGTASGSTGPAGAFSGTQYMYCETSAANIVATFRMNTKVYNTATEIPGNAIAFQLSRVGSSIGTLAVHMDDGTNTFGTVLGTFTGPAANEWNQITLQLPAGAPANVQFQFHYIAGGSFTGDLAIDDFCTL